MAKKKTEDDILKDYHEFKEASGFTICPYFILESPELKPQEKIMFMVIYSMSVKKGYFYGLNETLERKMNLKQWRVSNLITILENKGYLLPDYEMKKIGRYREVRINFESILPKARKFGEQREKALKKDGVKMKSE